jgi:molybdenum cofactor biosynthesis enzyme MoaA
VLYDELKSIDDEFPRIEKVMTTNAYLLPGKAELLYKNGVRRINVSVHDRSIYNTKFKKGIESAVENGIIICLNAIIERDKITSITEIIDFAKKYRVNIKFFPILGITNEETTELLKIADAEIVKYSFMSKFDKTKNRMIYHITENIAASLKYPADFEERPETCQACYLRDKCLEGCWDSIRITPWYIKPCGVRTDNIYYFSQNDTDKLKEKLISGGKLLNN